VSLCHPIGKGAILTGDLDDGRWLAPWLLLLLACRSAASAPNSTYGGAGRAAGGRQGQAGEGPKLQELDSCAFGEDHVTPAFRTGGPDSPALDVDILREFMRTVAESTISDWEIHDYGCHSLRIGREAQLRMSGARADTITDITSHT
jgi:hypothetical protein